jgi:hypothetical protein
MFTWRQCAEHGGWVFLWQKNAACPAEYEELFEPVSGVEVTRVLDSRANVVDSWHTHPDWKDPGGFLYQGLRPKPAVAAEVARWVGSLGGAGNYLSIHHRGTDLTQRMQKQGMKNTPPERQMEFLDQCPPDLPIWLATDDAATQDKFMARYGERMRFQEFGPASGKRQTGMSHALVDAYVCMLAKHHAGCWKSSFSAFIRHHRSRVSRAEIMSLVS